MFRCFLFFIFPFFCFGQSSFIQEQLDNGICPFDIDNPEDAIGLNFQGGIIFYVDETNNKLLITTNDDIGLGSFICQEANLSSNQILWNNLSNSFGSGLQNTINIIDLAEQNNCLETNGESFISAASMCYDLVYNGYDDWYLPSSDELYVLINNLYNQGLFGLYYGSNMSEPSFDVLPTSVGSFNYATSSICSCSGLENPEQFRYSWYVYDGNLVIDDVVCWPYLDDAPIYNGQFLVRPIREYSCDSNEINYGDVNCDGEVNSQDAALILQFISGLVEELPYGDLCE